MVQRTHSGQTLVTGPFSVSRILLITSLFIA